MQEVSLTSNVADLVAHTFISALALTRNFSFLDLEFSQWLFVDVGLSIEIDCKLFNVVDDETICCSLCLISLDSKLSQLSFHSDQLVCQSVITLSLFMDDLSPLILRLR